MNRQPQSPYRFTTRRQRARAPAWPNSSRRPKYTDSHRERTGNEIKFDKDLAGAQGYSRLLWQPESKTWKHVTAMKSANGEWQTTVNLTLTPVNQLCEKVGAAGNWAWKP
jgi:hypothetical protein